jgi:hypothetical protein
MPTKEMVACIAHYLAYGEKKSVHGKSPVAQASLIHEEF